MIGAVGITTRLHKPVGNLIEQTLHCRGGIFPTKGRHQPHMIRIGLARHTREARRLRGWQSHRVRACEAQRIAAREPCGTGQNCDENAPTRTGHHQANLIGGREPPKPPPRLFPWKAPARQPHARQSVRRATPIKPNPVLQTSQQP